MQVRAFPVHPRVCGEQFFHTRHLILIVGSSPRVRGTAAGAVLGVCSGRFIPACAGNRVNVPAVCVLSTVHPRVCGEQAYERGSRDS